jgi:hypothetical protein
MANSFDIVTLAKAFVKFQPQFVAEHPELFGNLTGFALEIVYQWLMTIKFGLPYPLLRLTTLNWRHRAVISDFCQVFTEEIV